MSKRDARHGDNPYEMLAIEIIRDAIYEASKPDNGQAQREARAFLRGPKCRRWVELLGCLVWDDCLAEIGLERR